MRMDETSVHLYHAPLLVESDWHMISCHKTYDWTTGIRPHIRDYMVVMQISISLLASSVLSSPSTEQPITHSRLPLTCNQSYRSSANRNCESGHNQKPDTPLCARGRELVVGKPGPTRARDLPMCVHVFVRASDAFNKITS